DYPNQTDEGIRSITVTPTGDIYAVVRVIGPDRFVDALVIHLNAAGEVLGQTLLSGAGDLVVNDSHLTASGNLLLAGALSLTANGLQAAVVELNPAGQIVQQRTVGNARESSLLDIEPAPAGGYFLAGYGSYCEGDADMLLAYLDESLENARESCLQAVNLALEVLPATSVSRRTAGEVAVREDPSVRIAATSLTNAGVQSENCPTLDLDADDSSSANTNGGFRIAVDCYDAPLPIADRDVFLNFDLPVPKRILLSLRDQVWGGPEYLSVPPALAGRVTEVDGATNLAVNALPGDTTEDLLDALRAVRYYNDAVQIEPGTRTVLIRIEYACFIGNIVEAEIEIRNGSVRDLGLRDTVICSGEELFVDVTTLGAKAYRWSDGAIDSVRTILDPGRYALTVTGTCSSVADTFLVSELPTELTPIPDRLDILCATDSLMVDLATANATSYRWDDGYLGPERIFSGSGTYKIIIGNTCTEFTTSVKIVEKACCQIYFPNVFSPNGDGVNDRFRPLPETDGCRGLNDWTLRVFNRWGGEVFQSPLPSEGWDGTVNGRPATTGTYVYSLRYFDGLALREEGGSVQLLR
ncbi:MAG: gliding motility-associated C-terminal domain-containing protein, partial [Bacteroidota bacterium]